jgi:serine/threonine protein phosphatase 1
MPAKRYVIGDIHGAYRPLMECFEKASFDYENDLLICLGDVCDGWPQVMDVIFELQKIKNFVMVMGNHDDYTLNWFETGEKRREWLQQGGNATLASYAYGIPESHKKFLKQAKKYYVTDFKIFVHGGFDPSLDISEQDSELLMWDRSLVETAISLDGEEKKLTVFDEVYLGHTPTLKLGVDKPLQLSEIWMMDTGAGWSRGKLTIMDIDSKEYFQSGIIQGYYPFFKGRG